MYEATSRIEELRRKFFSLEIYKLHISKEENLLVEDTNINGCVEDPLNGLKSWFLDLFKNWSKEFSERHWTRLSRFICFISRLEMKVKEIIKKLKGF